MHRQKQAKDAGQQPERQKLNQTALCAGSRERMQLQKSALSNVAERPKQMKTEILSIGFSNMDVSVNNCANGF